MRADAVCHEDSPPPERAVHLHLDPVGGLAGDMFVGALLDAFPEHAAAALGAAEDLSGVPCSTRQHGDGVLSGLRFDVRERAGQEPGRHPHGHHDAHSHVAWRDIRDHLIQSSLSAGARGHAIGIFSVLAEAEGRVHGITPEAVTFHEVGSADSIADIVAAAVIIDRLHDAAWSVGALPLGGGCVRTAHGMMPVPAPATARLLEGFESVDDGIGGERVTPTGAAILRHLRPVPRRGLHARLQRSGIGFGTRSLPGLSNVLRVLAFAPAMAARTGGTHRELGVICFEVDDQSGEELACGLDRVRGLPGVHDVLQVPVLGKKSRIAVHVQVLVRPDALDEVAEACFRETTTIGLRTHRVEGRALPRETVEMEVDGVPMRVKRVQRPGEVTGKAECEDARGVETHAARTRLRREAERRAADMQHV